MKPLLYKVNTKFFENPTDKGFQRLLLIEWVWECPKCGTELRQSKSVGGPKFILFLLLVLLVVWVITNP